jgi:predicted nucleic-acid-binding protein
MICLDTNVLARSIMQEDSRQSPKATRLIESLDAERPGFVTVVAVVELYWVLTACYGLAGHDVKQALEALLRAKQIVVDRADQVLGAVRVFDDGKADFADCLIERVASSAGCTETVTCDAGAAKYAGMSLLR